MYYGAIKECDIANGIGVRVSLFVSGCTNHCRACFQPETWDFSYGQPFTAETEETILKWLAPSYIRGLSVLGGEPFEPENQETLSPFLKRVRAQFPQKDIWVYTGYRLEELQGTAGRTVKDGPERPSRSAHVRTGVTDEMLQQIDVLVDGHFVQEMKNISLRFRGSENQRLIDLPATLRKQQEGGLEPGQVVAWTD